MKSLILGAFFFLLLTPNLVEAQEFKWPTDGFIGWKYYTETNRPEGIEGKYHTGIDIWGREDGGWNDNNEGSSNGVYSVSQGQIIWAEPNESGIIIKHNDNLYTKYWHLINHEVVVGDSVDSSSLLGYQGRAGNVVHLHLTVASSSIGYDRDSTLDPSAYFGVQLDERGIDPVPWMFKVTRLDVLNQCKDRSFMVVNTYNKDYICGVKDIIYVTPNARIVGESKLYIN